MEWSGLGLGARTHLRARAHLPPAARYRRTTSATQIAARVDGLTFLTMVLYPCLGVWAGGGASGAQGGATGGWAQGMGGTVKDERSPSLSSLTQQARRAGNTKGECQPLTLVATSESRSVRMATRGDADGRGASVQLAKFAHCAWWVPSSPSYGHGKGM